MRTRFDQFGKQMIREAFASGAAVETDAEVAANARHVDVWVMPEATRGAPRAGLGLLARMGAAPSTFELCHVTPDGDEVVSLVLKHGEFRHQLSLREPVPPLPTQWVISSGRADAGLDGLRFLPLPGWPSGFYGGPTLLFTHLVVVSELPVVRETLLLRHLGAGRVLRQAIAELKALPEDAPERTLALPILVRFRLEIPDDPKKRTPDDEEFLMETQDIVTRWRNEAIERERADAVIEVYEARFGPIPSQLRAAIEATHDVPTLRAWHKLAITRSKDEIAAAIHAARAS